MDADVSCAFDQRIREFAHYYTREVENLFLFLFGYLDKCPLLQKDDSNAANIVSGVAKIAELSNVIATVLKALEILKKQIDQKNAKSLGRLVYFFDDNSEEVRKMLIQASVEICYCFEHQFRVAALSGENPRSVMRKLAKEAAEKTLAYFLEAKPEQATKDDFTKAVILGRRINAKSTVEKMKTFFTGKNEEWNLHALIKKCGLVAEDLRFFTGTQSDSQTYGFRRLFSWEEVPETWLEVTAPAGSQHYLLRENLEILLTGCYEYIMTKNADDAAQLDRDIKQKELVDLLNQFKEENTQLVQVLQSGFADIMREIRVQNLMDGMTCPQGERRETELRCEQYGRKLKVTQTSNGIVTQWESEEDMKNLSLRQC